jgi:hypothetical protein
MPQPDPRRAIGTWPDEVFQGAAMTIPFQIADADGNVITSYGGTEALVCEVWPGGNRANSFFPVITWVNNALGEVLITISAADTAGVAIGRYQVYATLTPAMQDPVAILVTTIDVSATPGTTPTPTTYCSYQDLLKYGRSWIRQLQTSDDEAGFAEQLGRARSWIEDLAHAHYRVAAMTMVIGSQAFGPRRSGARSTWLQEQLDANTLILTDQIREASAKKALAFICEGQVGPAEGQAAYARLARMYHSQADYLGTCLTLSLDTNNDGFPDVNIDCSCTDPMMA